jgi:hypothetical protein
LARLDATDLDAVEAEYSRALALAEECRMRPLIARCHAGLSALYERVSKRHAAAKHLACATTLLKDMGMELWPESPEG